MANNTPAKSCKTCGHALRKETGVIGQYAFECRALPPSPVVFPVPNGGASIRWLWPITDESVCCGQYRPKEPFTERKAV